MVDSDQLNRRDVVKGATALGVVGLAGCSGGDGGDESDESDDGGAEHDGGDPA